jgi:neuron navigator 2
LKQNRFYWLLIILSQAFKRKKAHKKSISYKGEIESVVELKNILREKEMMITDMRLGSLAVNHRLEQLEDALKNSKEETNNLKRNKEFLERMMKSKIIE